MDVKAEYGKLRKEMTGGRGEREGNGWITGERQKGKERQIKERKGQKKNIE